MNEHTSAFGRAEISKQAGIGLCGITEIGTYKGKHLFPIGYVKQSEIIRCFQVGNCSKNKNKIRKKPQNNNQANNNVFRSRLLAFSENILHQILFLVGFGKTNSWPGSSREWIKRTNSLF